MPPTLATSRDIPILITSPASSSERRVTPSWTIAHLKIKLEPVTGIPPGSQRLALRLPNQQEEIVIQADDEGITEVGGWPLVAYAEIKVTSTNASSVPNLPPEASVPKQEMSKSTYETLSGTVLDYKKSHQIGRFDPNAPEKEVAKVKAMWTEILEKCLNINSRCCLSNESTRRGQVRFVGRISSLPGNAEAPWIGIALDEPFGKNDGSVDGERYFQCEKNRGLFVRPEKVEVGDFPELGLEEEDPDMEEL